ncbi:hypothetical protein [Bacillus altitudinis]|nr:hypothetical protein [Bacillus altitudinis]
MNKNLFLHPYSVNFEVQNSILKKQQNSAVFYWDELIGKIVLMLKEDFQQ